MMAKIFIRPILASLVASPARQGRSSTATRPLVNVAFNRLSVVDQPFCSGVSGLSTRLNLSSSSSSQAFSGKAASDGGDGSSTNNNNSSLRPGDKIQVEIVSFGPLGASADIIGLSHDENEDLLPPDEEPYAQGLILQKEIAYFRSARDNVDVVRGEILPAFVQNVREDGKVDVGLREFGGKAKAQGTGKLIMDMLEREGGTLPIGDKSAPGDINQFFPGVSKTTFKKAVGALYKQGLINPGPNSISLK